MKTTAIRMYGKEDLRMESFELPEIADDEILAHIVSDSICMSSYKAAKQGARMSTGAACSVHRRATFCQEITLTVRNSARP